jgi:ABC-2 type transport system permease protein
MLGSSASKSKKMMWFVVAAIIYSLGAFLFGLGYLFFQLGSVLSQVGMTEMLLLFLFVYSTGITIMFAMFRANGGLFHFRDYPILAPLPIAMWKIGVIKLMVLMINLYLTLLLVVSPILFSYFRFGNPGFLNTLFLIIGFFFIPMIPMAVCAFLSILIARITSLFRRSSLFNILFMLILFFAVMYFSMSSVFSGNENPFLGQVDFIQALGTHYPPMAWFAQAVHQGDPVALLLFISTGAIVFFLFGFLLGQTMKRTNTATMSTRTFRKTRSHSYEPNAVFHALVVKEFRKFLGVPLYALNSGFGLVMMVILGIASLFVRDQVITFLSEAGLAGFRPELMLLGFQGFCLATVYTSAISLSLEGKNFWIMKSIPVEPLTVVTAKTAFNILLGWSAAFVSTLLFTIAFRFSIGVFFLMIFVAASFSLLISVMGSLINLRFPKFDFISDVEVVKQSVGALFGIFGGFGLALADGFAFYGLNQLLPFGWSLFLVGGINLLLTWGLWLLLQRVTENLFMKLPA